jgi:hypothetical protein
MCQQIAIKHSMINMYILTFAGDNKVQRMNICCQMASYNMIEDNYTTIIIIESYIMQWFNKITTNISCFIRIYLITKLYYANVSTK